MELIRTRHELQRFRQSRQRGKLVLVPTMGALHAGHLSLVELAHRYGQVVVSIFVNPTQFLQGEDYDSYPQDLAEDLQALTPLDIAAVFAPHLEEMYPRESGILIQPGPRALSLCGAQRPGHFAGVLTVVAKLFNLVQPDLAIFGRKDAQQCLVIDEMVRDLAFSVRLLDGPTVRESDGLAMSSRNNYLSSEERKRATCLWQGLQRGRQLLGEGERDAAAIIEAVTAILQDADQVEYVEIRSVPDLTPVQRVCDHILLAVAASVGPARLIDNLVLAVQEDSVASAALLGGEASE